MEHTDGGRALQGSNDDQTGPNALSVGHRSPERDTIEEVLRRKPTLSAQDDNEHDAPPVTPVIWTEAPSPAEGRVAAEALQRFLPVVPPEGDDSERNKIGFKHNVIGEGSFDNEAVHYAFGRSKNLSGLQSPRDDERARTREGVANDTHPEQRWGSGGARLGQREFHVKSPEKDLGNLLGHHGVSVLTDGAIVDGERLTHKLVGNDVDHGRSFLEIDGEVKGEVNDDVDLEGIMGRVQHSAFIQQRDSFLQSSSDESIESAGEKGGGRNGITIVDRRTKENRGGLPHSEVGKPSVGDNCPANYQTKDPGTGVEENGASRRLDKEVEHVHERKASKNDPFHNEHWKRWLDNEDEQSEEGEKSPFQSRLSPSTRENISSSRLFPQSYDFERHRSSLFSVHFGNGSLLGSLHKGLPRSLSPTPSTRRGRLQNRTMLASKPDVSDEMADALLRAIPSGILINNGQRGNSIDSDPSQAEKALVSHEAFARLLISRRHIDSAVQDSPSSSLLGSEAGTGTTGSSTSKRGETAGNTSFSPFSTMPDSDESNGGTVGVYDLLEELDRPNTQGKEEEVEGKSSQENHTKESIERGDSNNLQMALLDAEEINFLTKNQKIRESMLLVEDLDFGMLPLARQVELLRDMSVVHFAKGETIFCMGESSDAMYFTLDITESTSYTTPNNGWHRADGTSKLLILETAPGEGKELQSREFWPSGRVLGEEGLIYSSERPRSWTIRAAVDLSCAVVYAPAFPNWWNFRLRLLIKKVAWLAKLAPTTQGNLLHAFKYVDSQADEVIIRQGESGDTFYTIMRGTAIVTLSSEPALASSSDDDTGTDADDDDTTVLGVETLPPCSDESYTTCQPGYEKGRVVAYPIRHEDGVKSAERRKDGSYGDGNKQGAVNRDGNRPPTASRAVQDIPDQECSMYVVDGDRYKNKQTRKKAPINKGEARNMSSEIITGTVSSSSGKTHFKDTKASPRSSTVNGERILARLHEGNDFGEMALVYDEPRNANVRAVTEMTCLVLGKDDFRKCLEDKAFHKHIEQEILQRAYYREQRVMECERVPLREDLEIPQPASSARKRRATTPGPRSSFRFTAKVTRRRGGDKADRDREVNNYRVLKKVGEGSFGSVYKVVNVYTDVVFAMKIINKPSKSGPKLKTFEQSLRREVSVMKVLRHPNVVTLWEVINDRRSRKVYMIQEFMERGPLLEEGYNVEPIPENEAVFKFIQVTMGLQYVHSYGICHGDIKPANILEDHNGRVKIADFGACVILDQDDEERVDESSSKGHQTPNRTIQSWCKFQKKSGRRVGGTPGFQAPELFEEGDTIKLSFASDVWALGVTLYQMVVGSMPFFGSSYRALMSAIKTEALTFPVDSHLEPYLMNLLHRMLRKNPATRITLEEVMRHEWITKEGLRPFGLEGSAKSSQENSRRFSSMSSPPSRSSRSTSPRRASSPSRLSDPDSPTSEAHTSGAQKSTLAHPSGDSSTGGSMDRHRHDEPRQMGDEGDKSLLDRKFSRRTIENFMNKRWGNFPPGIVCDAQKIIVDQPSFPHEHRSISCGAKKTQTLQVTKRKSTPRHGQDPGLPSTREPHQRPLLESSLPAASPSFSSGDLKRCCSPSTREHWCNRQLLNQEGEISSGFSQESIPIHERERQEQEQLQWEQHSIHWKPIVSPPGALRQMSLPQLMGGLKPSWREPFFNECTTGILPAKVREELDDSMALERSERLVRKADFLMLKMDSVQTSNARLVVSAKSGFSLVRPSGDRKVGSRRSSALHPGRPSFEGAGETPRMPHIPPFPVTDDGNEVEPFENRSRDECKHTEGFYTNSTSAIDSAHANQQRALPKSTTNTPIRFLSRGRPSLKGEASGDHRSSSKLPAARITATTVSTALTNKETTMNSMESMNMSNSSAASSGEKCLTLQKRWTEHKQADDWNCFAVTGKQRRIRTSLSFPRPISLQHSLLTYHCPINWIDAEEAKQSKHSFANVSGRRRVEVSDGEAQSRKEPEYRRSCRGRCPDRSLRNRPLVSGIKGDNSGDESCSRKPNVTNGYSNESFPHDGGGGGGSDGSIHASSSSSSSSSDDGLEEETSVVDITDCLDYIGNAVMERDDKDLAILDQAEILALSKGTVSHSLSLTWTGGGNKAPIGFKHGERFLAKTASIDRDGYTFGHVEARTWGDQVNAELGVRFGVSLNQGNLSFMEDTATCLANAFEVNRKTSGFKPPGALLAPADPVPIGTPEEEPGKGTAAYFAVFDGHGGADVAIHLQDTLHQRVLGDPSFPSNIPEAISNGCMATDLEYLKLAHEKRLAKTTEGEASSLHAPTLKRQGSDDGLSGAVSVMAILYRPPCPWSPSIFTYYINSSGGTSDTGASSGTLFQSPQQTPALEPRTHQFRPPIYLHVANVGDCRAVLCRAGKAVALTQDHTPAVASEVARIEAAGGFVSRCRVNGMLGVSRSFGDIRCKMYPPRQGQGIWDNQQVISRPEVHSIELTPADSFLILASDGLWGVLSNQQAVSFVHRRLLTHRDVQRAAVELIDKALDTSSYDNCTCIVVCLNQTRPWVIKRPTHALSRRSHSSISSRRP